ncbi:MAG: class I SAM-dependent methyltransferase [Candidatus Nanoarchaeia archaeon]|nr:class I SAM-dependent methyltransferase [Candidatus Omnitrophota bacterium]MDD5417464.1 class I SAM-dependent methyltransferase [Candidatus Nanoarchaeia archaeon]
MKDSIETYDKIAELWNDYRKKPFPEVSEILEKWKKEKRKIILDAGCGSGRNSIPAQRIGFKVVGFDSSFEMLKLARKNDSNSLYVAGDLRFPPFKKEIFDGVLYIASLHHLGKEDAEVSLKRIKETMKEKAEILISVWNKMQRRFIFSKKEVIVPWKKNREEHPRYYYLFTKTEFKNLVSKVKFKNISIFLDKAKKLTFFSRNIFALAEK